jgi:serine protease Do
MRRRVTGNVSLNGQGWRVVCALLAVLLAGTASGEEATSPVLHLTNGERVRSAFEDVVATPRTWTVRVLCDGKPVALGAVVGAEGWVLTKASQLSGSISCRFVDGRELLADYAAYAPEHDLALLKVAADDLTVATWHTGADPRIGQWLATPGLELTPVAVGIVSVGRRAIAADDVHGVLGIELEAIDGPPQIKRVFESSPAAQARLQVGDIVERVGDIVMESRPGLIEFIRKHKPGETLKLTVRRGREQLVIAATLTHPFGDFLSRIAMQNQMGGSLSVRRSGFPAAIQHDTVLKPQDCGGAVVNLDGEAVGVNIARAGRTESYAVPGAVVVSLLDDLKSGKYPPPVGGRWDAGLPPAPPVPQRWGGEGG